MTNELAPPQSPRGSLTPPVPQTTADTLAATDWMFGTAGHPEVQSGRGELGGYGHIQRKHKWLIRGVLGDSVVAGLE